MYEEITASLLTFEVSDIIDLEYSTLAGSGICTYNSDSFSLSSSTFTGLGHSTFGGTVALYMTSNTKGDSIPDSASHTITNVTFTSNRAFIWAALLVSDVNYLTITNTTFRSNYAVITEDVDLTGYGEAICYSTTDQISRLELDSTVIFEDNIAESSGGAIYWSYIEPLNINAQTYDNNQALLYGNDKVWFGQRLIQITESEFTNSSRLRSLSEYSRNDSLSLSSHSSGSEMPGLFLSLVDQYDQIISSGSSSNVTIFINTTDTPTTYTSVLSDTTTIIASNGKFNVSDISFTAEPGSYLQFILYCKWCRHEQAF